MTSLHGLLDENPERDLRCLCPLLVTVEAGDRFELAQDLVALHLERSATGGATRLLESYCEVLEDLVPEFRFVQQLPADLIEDEYLARMRDQGGVAPSLEDYGRRFPERADVLKRLAGRELASARFVLLDRLGGGGVAEVWRARDREAGDLVALKRVRPLVPDRRGIVALMRREASRPFPLRHPRIIAPREVVDVGDDVLLVMQLISGPSLGMAIQGLGRDPPATAAQRRAVRARFLKNLVECCEAVEFAHEHGVIHGDLSSANILLGEEGHAVIIDWGTPNADEGSPRVLGTPEFMAPEQLCGRVDASTDVFGLGALLHLVLFGEPPRSWGNGPRPREWRREVVSGRIAPFPRVSPRPSRRLRAICRQALSRCPNDRFADVSELIGALRSALP